jgi:CRISPR-associated protein (TIGR02710 family)
MDGKALVITVGVGVGANREEASKSIAHAIVFSIRGNNPNKIFFIVSKESKESVVPLVLEKLESGFAYELMEVSDENDLNNCFEVASRAIELAEEDGYRVTVDFTSGTKAMSAGAVLAATGKMANLSYVSGKRVGGKVVPGEEKLVISTSRKAVIEEQYRHLAKLFDAYQFASCIRLIDAIKETTGDPEEIERLKVYRDICEGYYQWDIFNHEKAKEFLSKIKEIPNENKEFLGRLTSTKERRESHLIADLLNNSQRRKKEGKYDDAVARLYRVVELLAQYVLKSRYDAETSNLQLGKIGRAVEKCPDLREELEREKDEKGRIRIGLTKSYKVLYCLGEKIGEEFFNNRRLQDLLGKRNESILAHGTMPITEHDYDQLYEEVIEVIRLSSFFPDLEELLNKSKFSNSSTIGLFK